MVSLYFWDVPQMDYVYRMRTVWTVGTYTVARIAYIIIERIFNLIVQLKINDGDRAENRIITILTRRLVLHLFFSRSILFFYLHN